MRLFHKTEIRFLDIRNLCYFGSTTLIVIGLISLFTRGVTFGIDFRGGTEIVVRFEHPTAVGDVRAALAPSGLGTSEIKTYGDARDILVRTTEQGEVTVIGTRIGAALTSAFPDQKIEIRKSYSISPKIVKELREGAVYAVIWSLVAILGYLAIRFKFAYGVGAVVALFHDVLVTLGIISLLNGVIPGLNLEISQEVIAAFLTLIGVSVNDTVVVFDRIRENEKIYRSMDLHTVMNRSLNDTLSRTIITSGTIFIVLVVLLFMGGEVNRGFAFAMTVGIVTGTYSSIYIASAFVLDWTNYQKKRKS